MRSSEGGILDLSQYLSDIGLPLHDVLSQATGCELCGDERAVKMRATARVADGVRTRFETLCCARCGLLFQSPRFEAAFYEAYYAHVYRMMVGGRGRPAPAYVADQVERGAALLASLEPWLPSTGQLLDVGCGAGGMMQPFLDRGWSALGIDPDEAATADASARGVPVVMDNAETMSLDRGRFDLIIITGSLEHVRDPHAVLERCHDAAAEGSLLLLEAHGLGQAAHLGEIGHNHRRLLTGTTMALLMLRHGWKVEWITEHPLCGPTRPGSIFALGRRTEVADTHMLQDAIERGLRDTPGAMAALLDQLEIR